jgi:hypothetical protein
VTVLVQASIKEAELRKSEKVNWLLSPSTMR